MNENELTRDELIQQLTETRKQLLALKQESMVDKNREIVSTLLSMLLENSTLNNENLLQLINKQFYTDSSSILRHLPETGEFTLEDFAFGPESSFSGIQKGIIIDNLAPEQQALYEKGQMCITYTGEKQAESSLHKFLHAFDIGVYSTLCLPLTSTNGFWGILVILRECNPSRWEEEDLSLLQLFAKALMLNIERLETQKELERQSNFKRLAFERSEVYSWEYRVKEDIFYNNEKIIERYGYPIGQQPVFTAERFFSIIHPEEVEMIKAAYLDVLKGIEGDVQVRVEVKKTDPTKTYEWFEFRFTPMKETNSNEINCIIGTATCIEKYKQAEIRLINLLKAKNEAEESDRLKSAFIANMSHEIRTPLNAIVGFSQILMETEDPADKEQFINIINNNSELLLRLIDDILDISIIESERGGFVYDNIDVNHLFDELQESVNLRLQKKYLLLTIEKGLPDCHTWMVRSRIIQVMMHLISNAIKFTSEGSITIGYKSINFGKELYFYVQDTGCGIAPEDQEKVFDRFVKLNNFVQGTGLGLSICKTIIKMLDGQIGVRSEKGKGAEFWFTLPYKLIQ